MCRCEIAMYNLQNQVFIDDSTSHHNHRRQVQCLLSKIVLLIASDLITCIVPVFKKLLETPWRKPVEANWLRKSSQMSLMNSGINDFGGAHFGFTPLLNDNIKIFVSIYPSSHHSQHFLKLCIAGNNMAGNLRRHEALQHHSIARLHLISEYNWECLLGLVFCSNMIRTRNRGHAFITCKWGPTSIA